LAEQSKTDSPQEFMEKMAFQKVKKMLTTSGCVNCNGYRDEYLKRRFEVRLRATGANTYGRYIIHLKNHPEEFHNLLNDLTINFTSFFRDTDVYTYLEKKLLPKLLWTTNPLKIWSAGCASGEEPYSLAILIHKLLGQTLSSHSITIFASDIDNDSLIKAAEGKYQLRQIGNISSLLVEKYFTKKDEDYVVKDFVKQIIHFEHFDLMSPPKHQDLDLVLCRNVMIYFSKEGQQHIHLGFYNALKEGGYFITGKSEILSGEPAQKFAVIDNQTRIYQKPRQHSNILVDTLGHSIENDLYHLT